MGRWTIVSSFAAVLAIGTGTPARAHHVISDYSIASVEPRSTVELELQSARFELGEDRRGVWHAIAPRFEYSFFSRVSLFARVPVVAIDHAEDENVAGLGDVELGAMARLYGSKHGELIASAGIAGELPTGDKYNGIGNGHFELSPFLAISAQPAPTLVLYGLFADRLSFGGEHAHAAGVRAHEHGSVIEPHAEHEVFARLAASFVTHGAYISAGTDLIAVISGDRSGTAILRTDAGLVLIEELRVAAGVDLPFAGEPRFTWRARAGLVWSF